MYGCRVLALVHSIVYLWLGSCSLCDLHIVNVILSDTWNLSEMSTGYHYPHYKDGDHAETSDVSELNTHTKQLCESDDSLCECKSEVM